MADNLQQSFLNKSRQDKFLLVLGLPKAFLKINPDISVRELQLSVYGSPVPSISVPAIDVPTQGQTLKVTSQSRPAYGPLTVNFTIDSEFKNYWTLWKWLDIMNHSEQSKMNDYFDKYQEIQLTDALTNTSFTKVINKNQNESVYFDYMTDLTIFGLDEYNNRKIKFLYKNAFITDLSEISYNYRTVDELESTVSFAFSQLQVALLSECSD